MHASRHLSALLFCTLLLSLPKAALAHCQIPCGIFDDYARVTAMLEDAVTIEKSARLIEELAGKSDAQSQNQMMRWVMNKEVHAQKVIETMGDYFLSQRVKTSQEDYEQRLVHHHAVILAAMKTKQTADPEAAKDLMAAIKELVAYYPAPDHHHH
jgi:nickel superoxide dismutase